MLASGQDFLKSKFGISNTYQRGDINALDYNRRTYFSGTHAYFRDWIQFRLSSDGKALCYDGRISESYLQFFFAKGSSAVVVLINADRSVDAPQVVYAVNPHFEYADVLCEQIRPTDLKQVADQERFNLEGIDTARIPISNKQINLPPLSCGLWMYKSLTQ